MNLIKLSAIDSTNAELRRRLQREKLPDLTIVWALEQTKGKGQRGASWNSEKGKNLTFSLLKRFEALESADHFRINMLVSIAITHALEALKIPNLSIKWPNDILSGNSKICGILAENSLTGNCIQYSIIGIGLNVNQEEFEGLPNAGSLKRVTGSDFDLETVFLQLYASLTSTLAREDSINPQYLRKTYQQKLFGYNQLRRFQTATETFTGEIRGVNREGRLIIKKQGGTEEFFGLKEISFIY